MVQKSLEVSQRRQTREAWARAKGSLTRSDEHSRREKAAVDKEWKEIKKEGTQKESPLCSTDGPPPILKYEYSAENVHKDNLKRGHEYEYILGHSRKSSLKWGNNFVHKEIVQRRRFSSLARTTCSYPRRFQKTRRAKHAVVQASMALRQLVIYFLNWFNH